MQAFLRSLHDPFPFARKAGLMGIGATSASFSTDDIARKIIPNVSSLLVDADRSIRDQAFTTIEGLLKILREASKSRPDPVANPNSDAVAGPTAVNKEGWASWAFSAVSSTVTSVSKPSDSTAAHKPTSIPNDNPILQQTTLPTSVQKPAVSPPKQESAVHRSSWDSSSSKQQTRLSNTGFNKEEQDWDEDWNGTDPKASHGPAGTVTQSVPSKPVQAQKVASDWNDGWNSGKNSAWEEDWD